MLSAIANMPFYMGLPKSFCALKTMFGIHAFVLDVGIINVLPFISTEASDAQRVDKFPWVHMHVHGACVVHVHVLRAPRYRHGLRLPRAGARRGGR